MLLHFHHSTIYSSQDIEPTKKVHWQKNEDYVMHLHSEILLSHKTEKNIILAAACMHWETCILREVSQRERDKYCKILQTVGIYKFIPVNTFTKQKRTRRLRKPNYDYQKKVNYSAIKKNAFESVLMRWMKLETIIQSEVSQKEKTPNTVY